MKLAGRVTLFNAVLTAAFVILVGLSFAVSGSDSALRRALDIPTYVAFWGYVVVTPIAFAVSMLSGRESRRPITLNVILLLSWIVVVALTALMPLG